MPSSSVPPELLRSFSHLLHLKRQVANHIRVSTSIDTICHPHEHNLTATLAIRVHWAKQEFGVEAKEEAGAEAEEEEEGEEAAREEAGADTEKQGAEEAGGVARTVVGEEAGGVVGTVVGEEELRKAEVYPRPRINGVVWDAANSEVIRYSVLKTATAITHANPSA
jgi:hypothetical protein